MAHIEQKLADLGLVLPEPVKLPPDVRLPFSLVNIRERRVFVSGHGPQNDDGSIAGPFGKLGKDVTVEEGYELARKTALSMLASLKRELMDLDRIQAWCRVFGMVNCAPEFTQQPAVINGFSDLIYELFGPEAGRHARSAVGMAALPMGDGIAVEIEAEVLID
ncbi:RidA family protein [Hoeflea poritis]|uniref:RidA family protein n=1 Tax=Hoeflea poritis TaxID=2993659 RepID=A0ABT4VL16_9HYPH|nr:RidA family protein [Hoeflea poritis]MDA4845366.1 RidA family protein [Hoeflea poritis]